MTETDKIRLVQVEAEEPSRAVTPLRPNTWRKVVLCGSPDVGKTSIYTRIIDNRFETNGSQTAPQECTVDVPVDNAETVKVSVVNKIVLNFLK